MCGPALEFLSSVLLSNLVLLYNRVLNASYTECLQLILTCCVLLWNVTIHRRCLQMSLWIIKKIAFYTFWPSRWTINAHDCFVSFVITYSRMHGSEWVCTDFVLLSELHSMWRYGGNRMALMLHPCRKDSLTCSILETMSSGTHQSHLLHHRWER